MYIYILKMKCIYIYLKDESCEIWHLSTNCWMLFQNNLVSIRGLSSPYSLLVQQVLFTKIAFYDLIISYQYYQLSLLDWLQRLFHTSVMCLPLSPVQDWLQCRRHLHERGGSSLGDPQILPVGDIESLAHDQNLWRSHRLLHHLCGVYGMRGDDSFRRSH